MRGSPALAAAIALAVLGCSGSLRTMTAPPGDLEDYRAFRVAAAPGTRLARAQAYLERHPKGAFADEVRAAFEEEEPRFFAACQTTRKGALRYLVDLPRGPHAEAAFALLRALESSMEDAELEDVARRVRQGDVRLEAAAAQRRAVGEAILGAVGVLLDEDSYGRARDEASPALRELLSGPVASTWGALPSQRERDLFFSIPTRPERESRLLTLEMTLREEGGVVTGATLAGADLFVRWTEADRIVRLDPDAPEDRIEARVHAMDRLSGALERRFPVARCPDARGEDELYHRACDGWEAVVVGGDRAGAADRIVIRAPRAERGTRAAEPR